MIKTIQASAFLTALFALTISANANDLKELSERASDACEDDIEKLCHDVMPGEGRIAACLESKKDKVSEACTNAVVDVSTEVKARYEKLAAQFNKSCSSDIAKYCGRVPAGQGRVLSCLSGRQQDLSKTCHGFLDQASDKIDKMLQD
jgi:hypothetical protein